MQKGTITTLNWLGIISLVISYIFAYLFLEDDFFTLNLVTLLDILILIVFIMNIRFISKMKQ